MPTETANPELGAADVAKTGGANGSDMTPHDVITGNRKFEEEDMFRAQQSGPSRSKGGKNRKKYLPNKDLLDLERGKAKPKAGSDGVKHAE